VERACRRGSTSERSPCCWLSISPTGRF
jgi:hypothetical protein